MASMSAAVGSALDLLRFRRGVGPQVFSHPIISTLAAKSNRFYDSLSTTQSRYVLFIIARSQSKDTGCAVTHDAMLQ